MGLEETEFYENIYRITQDKGLSKWFIDKTHRKLETASKPTITTSNILEVGGNIGEHIKFVQEDFKTYLLTDYRQTGFKSLNSRIRFEVADVQNLPYPNESFDRVIATCLVHHVPDLERTLKEMLRVVKKNGQIQILIPCDPGVAYRLAKFIGPSRVWKKNGITNPDFTHYSQHINHFAQISAFVNFFYRSQQVKWNYWPFRFRSWNLNLFATLCVTRKN